ncbi:hypothetical protein HDU98_009743 [Podochytrium sp. JEL0797]|nr:hypothetical protein HDU98_009743 [Podochytrium sp. JEL0797]
MDPPAAFTVYFTDASCAGNATRLGYDTSAACVPSASVTPCQPSAAYPNWHVLKGCTNNYTATGTTYFGPGMQVQYQQAQPSPLSCSNTFGDGGQFPINQCVPSLSAISPFGSESITVHGSLFQPSYSLTFFTDTRCMNASQTFTFGTGECFDYNIINDYGWYQDVFGACPFAAPSSAPPMGLPTSPPMPVLPSPVLPGSISSGGSIPNGSITSPPVTPLNAWIQTGRSLSQPCVPTPPSQCSSNGGIVRSCSPQFNETLFNMQSLELFRFSEFVQWKRGNDSNVLSQTILALGPFICTTVGNDSIWVNSLVESDSTSSVARIWFFESSRFCTAENAFPAEMKFLLRIAQSAGDECFLDGISGCVWNKWMYPGSSENLNLLWLAMIPVVGLLVCIAFRFRTFVNAQQGGGGGRLALEQSQSIEMGDPVLREGEGLPVYDDAAPEYAASPELEAAK